MEIAARLEYLYLLNATLLISHEIDSAYWKEWSLFHLPGGIQLFVLLHLLLLPMVLYGYRVVCRRSSHARLASIMLAFAGIFAAMLHGAFILAGNPAFSLPLSRILLVMTFIVSLMQLYTALRPGWHR